MDNNSDKANKAFLLPLISLGLILGYFFSQAFVFVFAAQLMGQELTELSSKVKFFAVALNAAAWVAITTSLIPKLPLPEMKEKKSMPEQIKVYFICFFTLYACMYLYSIIMQAVNFNPQQQEVANEVQSLGNEALFLVILGPVILIPIIEELLFRGLLHRALKTALSPLTASVIAAVLFGLAHIEPDTIPQLIIIGLVLSYAYEAAGSIWVPIALHATNNGISVLVLIFGPELLKNAQESASILTILFTSF